MKKNILMALLFLNLAAIGKVSSGKITMKFDLSRQSNSSITQLWIPYPTTNKYQKITNIEITGDYLSSVVYTDSLFETPMLYTKWNAGVKKRTLTFSFNVIRKEVVVKKFPRKEVSWDTVDYLLNLAPTQFAPLNGSIKKLADKITNGKYGVLEKAKAIYDWTCENTYRDPKTNGCGVGDVYKLLKRPGGKCADISSVFVALCRAAGIPAKDIFGIRQGKEDLQDITKWYHCWAEFYLPGYGWVTVDPADVRKMMLKQDLDNNSPETDNLREYFWGSVDSYRVKLSEGRDLTLNPPQVGNPVNYLMYPFAQIGDETLDWLEPEKFRYKITYELK